MRIELAGCEDNALIDVRFSRARAQLELVDHPLVAQIIDHGVLSNGRPWVASQRPAGTPLSYVLGQRRLEARETVALIYSVAQVLALAHHHQVVHGSLRPHHLTLSKGAKVSISGWSWLRTPGIPAFGDPASTSVYHPPEHDGQSPIDGRADVYALGAIAYRALTGVFPDVSRDLVDGNSPLGAVIENMLALDARDRLSAAAVVADLHEQRKADRASSRDLEGRPTNRMSSPSIDRLVVIDRTAEADEPNTKPAPSSASSGESSVEIESRRTNRMKSPDPDQEGTDIEPPRMLEVLDATDREVSVDIETDIEDCRTGRMASVHD